MQYSGSRPFAAVFEQHLQGLNRLVYHEEIQLDWSYSENKLPPGFKDMVDLKTAVQWVPTFRCHLCAASSGVKKDLVCIHKCSLSTAGVVSVKTYGFEGRAVEGMLTFRCYVYVESSGVSS